MNILIKQEVLEDYEIEIAKLLLCPDTLEVFQFDSADELEHLYKIKWTIENKTIIIYKEEEKDK